MKLTEAYKILDLPETATEDEVNKKFRKLAAQYHPDQNKDTDAEAKFKEINSAYQVIKDPQKNAEPDFQGGFGGGFGFNIEDLFKRSGFSEVFINGQRIKINHKPPPQNK